MRDDREKCQECFQSQSGYGQVAYQIFGDRRGEDYITEDHRVKVVGKRIIQSVLNDDPGTVHLEVQVKVLKPFRGVPKHLNSYRLPLHEMTVNGEEFE